MNLNININVNTIVIMSIDPREVQFRVRACGAKEVQDACSEWSNVQTCHTILSAAQAPPSLSLSLNLSL